MSTNVVSAKDIKREWKLIDAKDQILGRLASEIATILMGKKKANHVDYLDMGDYVVVTNAAKVKVTGKKLKTKTYYTHSGYPGGLRSEVLSDVIAKKPQQVIEHAVRGMLPHTRLGRQMITKLKVFAGSDHSFKKQIGDKS